MGRDSNGLPLMDSGGGLMSHFVESGRQQTAVNGRHLVLSVGGRRDGLMAATRPSAVGDCPQLINNF